MIDHLLNTNFQKCSKYQIYQELKYARNFIKAEKIEDYTTIQKAIEETISAKLQELTENLNLISEEIQNILPFELPIKKRSQIAAIVNILRIIYNFSQLSEIYFKELPQLPKELYDLLMEIRYAFPMHSRNQLQQLRYHVQKLRDNYSFN